MNFLQLCQSLARESGVSGALTTTFGQIGSLGRIVNWVNDAWNETQTSRDDWDWLRSSNILGGGVSFIPALGQATVPLGIAAGQLGVAADSFGKWDRETFRCFTTAIFLSTGFPLDETFVDEVPFDTWRNAYMLGAMRNVRTRPYVVAVGPDQSLNLGPPSNGNYTITGDYWMAPTRMVNDTDVPVGLPEKFHMLIVYRALFKYGFYEAASDVLQRAENEWNSMYRQLEALRLPTMGFAGAL